MRVFVKATFKVRKINDHIMTTKCCQFEERQERFSNDAFSHLQ